MKIRALSTESITHAMAFAKTGSVDRSRACAPEAPTTRIAASCGARNRLRMPLRHRPHRRPCLRHRPYRHPRLFFLPLHPQHPHHPVLPFTRAFLWIDFATMMQTVVPGSFAKAIQMMTMILVVGAECHHPLHRLHHLQALALSMASRAPLRFSTIVATVSSATMSTMTTTKACVDHPRVVVGFRKAPNCHPRHHRHRRCHRRRSHLPGRRMLQRTTWDTLPEPVKGLRCGFRTQTLFSAHAHTRACTRHKAVPRRLSSSVPIKGLGHTVGTSLYAFTIQPRRFASIRFVCLEPSTTVRYRRCHHLQVRPLRHRASKTIPSAHTLRWIVVMGLRVNW